MYNINIAQCKPFFKEQNLEKFDSLGWFIMIIFVVKFTVIPVCISPVKLKSILTAG